MNFHSLIFNERIHTSSKASRSGAAFSTSSRHQGVPSLDNFASTSTWSPHCPSPGYSSTINDLDLFMRLAQCMPSANSHPATVGMADSYPPSMFSTYADPSQQMYFSDDLHDFLEPSDDSSTHSLFSSSTSSLNQDLMNSLPEGITTTTAAAFNMSQQPHQAYLSMDDLPPPGAYSIPNTPPMSHSPSDSEPASSTESLTASPVIRQRHAPLPPSHNNIQQQHHSDVVDVVRTCVHCGTSSTSAWRRVPGYSEPMCNACGLYVQQRNMLRPKNLIEADFENANQGEEPEDPTYVGPTCSHCQTRKTSVWRRSKEGLHLCNACGVYSRLRGKERPLSLKKNTVKPRAKRTQS